MAEIFLARGASVGGVERYVVLKRILRHRAGDAQLVRMFLDEARLAAQLQHANIAQVYDVGKLGDSYFFTMEYVHGETLRALLHRSRALRRSLPLNCVLTIAAGAAAGLHYAHERVARDGQPLGIVHRDVSPSNLMVSFDGNLKIVDFGVAKAADRIVETRSGTVKGKIGYLSPEQCKGGNVDRRCDLFAIGIVMWEMLATERLYRRATDFENMTAIVNEPPPPPSSRRSDVPPELDALVLRLLEKDPELRFQTGAELLEAIEEVAMRTQSMLSTASVSRYLRELFGQRPEPWVELQSIEPNEAQVTVTGEELADMPPQPSVLDIQLAAVRDLTRHQVEASGKIVPPVAQPMGPIPQPPVTITVVAESIEKLGTPAPPHLAPTLIAPPIEDTGTPPSMPSMIPPVPVINPSSPSHRGSGPQIPIGDPAKTLRGVGTGGRPSIAVTAPFESPTTPYQAQPQKREVSRKMIVLFTAALGVIIGIAVAAWLGTRPTGMAPPQDDPAPTTPVATAAADATITQIAPDAAAVVAAADAAEAPVAVAPSAPPNPPCNVDKLRDKGMELSSSGNHAAALAAFNEALACEPSPPLLRLTFMSACQAGNATRAKELYGQLPAASQPGLAQICARNRIELGPKPEVTRRPEAPTLNQLFQQNRFTDAVAACTQSFSADRATLCVLAACHAHDAAKAKKWLRSVPAAKRQTTATACQHAGTTIETPATPTPPTPKKPPPDGDCDPNDLLSCQHTND
jgi:serine/threonine protein kinase